MKKSLQTLIEKVMTHNNYQNNQITATECDKIDRWTPVDLIIREYLNNGGGSAKGFLGIQPYQCRKAYEELKQIKQELIDKDLIHKDAWNASGFTLWTDYNF